MTATLRPGGHSGVRLSQTKPIARLTTALATCPIHLVWRLGGRGRSCEGRGAAAGRAVLSRRGGIAVECEDCGASWQDVWALVHMDKVQGDSGKEVSA